MKFINILDIDKPNNLSEFLNYKKLLEKELNLDKEMSYEDYIKHLGLEKHLFVYKQNYTFTFNKLKINDEDILFYTADNNFPEESLKLFYSLVENFDEKSLNKLNIFSGDDNILDKEYYYIINNEFYY